MATAAENEGRSTLGFLGASSDKPAASPAFCLAPDCPYCISEDQPNPPLWVCPGRGSGYL